MFARQFQLFVEFCRNSRGARSRAPGSRGRGLICMVAVLAVASWCSAAAGGENPYRPSISRAARQDAIDSIPFDHLPPDSREPVAAALGETSIFRRLPIQVMECDPDLYLYVVDHPEIIANIWQLMGIENVVLSPIGPDLYRADDGGGTTGTVRYLHRSHDTHVILAEGAYDGPMFTNPVAGTCLLVLKTGYLRETNGKYYITNRLDAFVHLDHAALELLAKTFHPLVGRVADYNFLATGTFMENLSRTAEANPAGMRRLAERLEHIRPEVRGEFIRLTSRVAEKEALRQARMVHHRERSSVKPTTTRAQNR